MVGELCAEEGKAVVAALGGTIVYTLKPDRAPTELYTVKVLTVVTNQCEFEAMHGMPLCTTGEGDKQTHGTAGHVTLTYASGGQLITSNGHWIELTRVNTSDESVRKVAAKNFGCEKLQAFEDEWAGATSASDKYECTQKYAKQMVQESVASRMKCRTKF